VVAEEVERLAERSTGATKKIAALVKTIQSETNEAVGSMEKSIHEVVEGSKLANQAGDSLAEIGATSTRLARLIQSISEAAKQQAIGSDDIAKSMSKISQITQQTTAGTRRAADSMSELEALADALRNSVSAFRLPAKRAQSDGLAAGMNDDGNGQAGLPDLDAVERNGRSREFRRFPARA
jgi:twitching motility protein PilJ